MKKKLLRVLSCIVFLALCSLAVVKCSEILENKRAKIKYEPFFSSRTNFDVIFMGSSHMYNSVLPMELWKEYGISSYNWGYSNCTPAENYYLLQEIVKYTSPKLVVVDMYGLVEYDRTRNGKYRTDKIEQQHVQFDSFPVWSGNKAAAARDVFDDYSGKYDFIWNFIMYHNRWNELGKTDFQYSVSTQKGAALLSNLSPGEVIFSPLPAGEKTKIDSVCYPYFLKLLEFCGEKNIPVLCIYIPYPADEKSQRVANSLDDVIREYPHCAYVNMLDKNILDYSIDQSKSPTHSNYSGASKITSWLGKYISEHYDLDDYSDNEYWIRDYRAYHDYKTQTILKQTTLPECLVLLKDPDFDAELEVYSQSLYESKRFTALCGNAGITPILKETDGDECARIRIRSGGRLITEAVYRYTAADGFDIMKVEKTGKTTEESDEPE